MLTPSAVLMGLYGLKCATGKLKLVPVTDSLAVIGSFPGLGLGCQHSGKYHTLGLCLELYGAALGP